MSFLIINDINKLNLTNIEILNPIEEPAFLRKISELS